LNSQLDSWPGNQQVLTARGGEKAYLQTIGPVAIVSDGYQVFQPLKIRKSGLFSAVHGDVRSLPPSALAAPAS
jgi:hypothetical protein